MADHRISTTIAVLSGLALCSPAMAGSQNPPAQLACGQSTTKCFQLAPRTNALTWIPANNATLTQAAGTWVNGSGGAAFMLTTEMMDAFDGVQIGFANIDTNPWTLLDATVTSSSSYNSDGLTTIDSAGNVNPTSLPVTFNHQGNISGPWPGPVNANYGSTTGGGRFMLPFVLNAATAVGNGTLHVASNSSSSLDVVGQTLAKQGMYVTASPTGSNLISCIPPNTTLTSVTSTTFVMSNNAVDVGGGTGCQNGQEVWLTWAPIIAPPGQTNQLSITIPATANPPQPNIVWSDVIPLPYRPRLDGSVLNGMQVTGSASIPAGTTSLIVTQAGSPAYSEQTIGLSAALTGSIAGATPIFLSMTPTAAIDAPTGSYFLTVSDATNLRVGQLASSANGSIPASDYVTEVDAANKRVTLAVATSGDTPPNTVLTFSNKYRLPSSANPGDTTLSLGPNFTASDRPLLQIRGFVASGAATAHGWGSTGGPGVEYQNYGIRTLLSRYGPQSAGSAVDIVSFPGSTVTGGANAPTPVYAIRYFTQHAGIECLIAGDSHMAGDSTSSGTMGYAKYACYQIATPTVPVEVAAVAHGGLDDTQYLPSITDLAQAISPSFIIFQSNTGNSSQSPKMNINATDSLRYWAQSFGARAVITTDYTRAGTNDPLAMATLAPTTASTTVSLWGGVPSGVASTPATYAVSWPGSPLGMTATFGSANHTITLASPQTIPANTIISLNDITATVTSGSNAVTLATPWPQTTAGVFTVTDTLGLIPAGTTWSGTGGSTSGTLSANPTGSSAADVLHFSVVSNSSVVSHVINGNAITRRMGTAGQPVLFDAYNIISPPPTGLFLPGTSFDGVHANDFGAMHYLAPPLENVLRQMRGN